MTKILFPMSSDAVFCVSNSENNVLGIWISYNPAFGMSHFQPPPQTHKEEKEELICIQHFRRELTLLSFRGTSPSISGVRTSIGLIKLFSFFQKMAEVRTMSTVSLDVLVNGRGYVVICFSVFLHTGGLQSYSKRIWSEPRTCSPAFNYISWESHRSNMVCFLFDE